MTGGPVLSLISGVLFASGWWFFVDGGYEYSRAGHKFEFVEWIPGIVSTVAFFLIQLCNPNHMRSDSMFDEGRARRAKIFFFISLFVGFSGLISAVWIMVDQVKDPPYPGVTLLLQAFLIVLASVLIWLARSENTEDQGAFF